MIERSESSLKILRFFILTTQYGCLGVTCFLNINFQISKLYILLLFFYINRKFLNQILWKKDKKYLTTFVKKKKNYNSYIQILRYILTCLITYWVFIKNYVKCVWGITTYCTRQIWDSIWKKIVQNESHDIRVL